MSSRDRPGSELRPGETDAMTTVHEVLEELGIPAPDGGGEDEPDPPPDLEHEPLGRLGPRTLQRLVEELVAEDGPEGPRRR